MAMKPLTLYSAPFGPNPYKVAIILTELGIPYTTKNIWNAAELKQSPFTDVNPNGRAPAIEDPNTGIVLWESCAIVKYLIAEYDKSNTLSYTTSPEKYLLDQWCYFQASGQGPYYGQAAWFNIFHPEKLPSAQKRYTDEMKRVIAVLDGELSKSASGWLVGDKCTYADLAFFMWDEQVAAIISATDEKWDPTQFPKWYNWHERMAERTAVKQVVVEKAKLLTDAQH